MKDKPLKVKKTRQQVDRIHDDDCLVYSIAEAGRRLGIARATAYWHVKQGHLPVIRLGDRLLVPKVALAKMIAGQ
jgi:excisionase family DNA binding protein